MAHTPIQFVILSTLKFSLYMRRNRRERGVCTQIKALPFQSSHENVKVLQWQRNLPKSVLASRITTQKNSWYASILPKNQRFSEKRKAEIDVHKYPYRSSNLFSGLLEKKDDI